MGSGLFVAFNEGHEGLGRDIDFAEAFHASLTLFLFITQLVFARDVATVETGDNVFAEGRDVLASDEFGTDGRFSMMP